jgi:hypothetical protein
MRRARDCEIRVVKEECNDLAMSRLCGVCELKPLKTVLENIREREETAFASLDRANLLDGPMVIRTTKDIFQPLVLTLLVIYAAWAEGRAHLLEGKGRRSNVFG